MIRKENELRVSVTPHAKGGEGECINSHIVEKDELCNKGRFYAKCFLAPGHSVGNHTHTGEMEICHFISGTGVVESNGVKTPIQAGDTNIVFDGENHRVINTGKENLIYTALILYT